MGETKITYKKTDCNLYFHGFLATFQVLVDQQLQRRFYGDYLHNAMATTMRKIVACPEADTNAESKCTQCPDSLDCPFTSLFGYDGTNRPRPLFPLIEMDKDQWHCGESVDVGLILVGRAGQYVSHLRKALENLHKSPRDNPCSYLRLAHFEPLSLSGNISTKEAQGNMTFNEAWYSFSEIEQMVSLFLKYNPVKRIGIQFSTPTRIQVFDENRNRSFLYNAPSFEVLINSINKRLENLTSYYPDTKLPTVSDLLLKKASGVKLVKDDTSLYRFHKYSKHKSRHQGFSGIIGEAVYQGDIDEFLPALTLGEWLLIGKNTSYGMGRYKIRIL